MDKGLFALAIMGIFTQNFIMVKFMGICPFLGVSKKVETAFGMGMAVMFVMVVASFLTYLTQTFILVPLNAEYLQTLSFILVIAGLVQFVEMFLAKTMPALYNSLGIYLPLITTNCAVLGVALLNIELELNLLGSVWYAFCASIGFTLSIVLFAGIRERLENADIPEFLKGFPIALITAGLMSIAFLGFSGLSF
ncbi:MAG: electron transport complex subunit RsxA [Ruminococcaceae bacterium]|nr:electron transport complex subunit RsxA [Oscillospiraceae bacterium]